MKNLLKKKKKCFKLSEVMVGSGIRKKPIPDPGSGGKKGPGSGSATLVKGDHLDQVHSHQKVFKMIRWGRLLSEAKSPELA